VRAGAAALLLITAACGTKSPCTANTCEGCCTSGGVCALGTASAACGSAGAECKNCLGELCFDGACTPATACTRDGDCSAIGCRCGDGANVETKGCKTGRCQSPGELCDGACVAAGHPRPGTGGDGGMTISFCVDGTSSSCFGADLTWSGNQCCVASGYGQCAMGTAAACFGPDLEWTGATCCVKQGYGRCLEGTVGACTGDSLEWTGLQCCVRDAFNLCADGNASACSTADVAWTGSKCCVAFEYTTCVDGTELACQGVNMRWTGAKCCVRNRTACSAGSATTCSGDWTGSLCCS